MLAVLLSLAAAFLFAAGTVLQQQVATDATDEEALGAGFLLQLARKPRWLAGIAIDGLGFVCQAIALGVGRLVVVQPLLAMTVVFAQSGSFSVVETTYLGIVLMRSDNGSPDRVCQTGAKLSYVRRPISTASHDISRSVWICPARSSGGRSIVGHSCGCSTTPSSEM